jgi:hypothetical protein
VVFDTLPNRIEPQAWLTNSSSAPPAGGLPIDE